MEKFFTFLKESTGIISTILAIVAAYFALMSNFKVDALQDQLKQVELSNKESDLLFKMYEKVETAITEEDSNKITFTKKIIEREIKNDTIRELFIVALSKNKHASKEIKKEAITLNKFDSITNNININTNKIRIDIFYVEDTQIMSKPKATQIANALKNTYIVRLRLLPSIINQRAGYQLKNSQIRFEEKEANENEVAQKLLQQLQKYETLALQPATMNTPNYISIFIY